MGKLSRFMKQNKEVKENTTFAATTSLTDENGKTLDWEIKPLTSKEIQEIRDTCSTEVPINAKKSMYREKLNTNKFGAKLIATSVVEPNLLDAELQDSYGVKTPEDLAMEMIDSPGEYADFLSFVQKFNNLNKDFEDKVEEVKN